jgi:protein-S-isoprenylcysteine O-methyltransferase Ste14
MGRIGPIAILAVAGFDVRFHWSPALALAAPIAGVTLLVLGYALSDWAVMANRFFAPVVRIQTERGHAVIQTGPYRWLRHPGYAGAALVYLATPLMLSSVWALIPAVLTIGVIIVRTALEDRTLLQELAGHGLNAAHASKRARPAPTACSRHILRKRLARNRRNCLQKTLDKAHNV